MGCVSRVESEAPCGVQTSRVIKTVQRALSIPFKDKGKLLRAARESTQRCYDLGLAMEELAAEFRARFPPPQPLRLVIQDTGRMRYLRWRRQGRGQPCVDFDDEDTYVINLLSQFPRGKARDWLRLHRSAVRLNAAYSIHRHRQLQLVDAMTKLAQTDRLQNRVFMARDA